MNPNPIDVTLHAIVELDCSSRMSTRKKNLPANQKGYDKSETTFGTLLAKKNQICEDSLVWPIFTLFKILSK